MSPFLCHFPRPPSICSSTTSKHSLSFISRRYYSRVFLNSGRDFLRLEQIGARIWAKERDNRRSRTHPHCVEELNHRCASRGYSTSAGDNGITANTSTSSNLTQKQLRRKNVALIAEHLKETDLHPSPESIRHIQQMFRIESLDETRQLLSIARERLRRNPLTAQQKAIVKECFERLPRGYSLQNLYKLVQEQTNVKGDGMRRHIATHSAKLELATLTENQLLSLKAYIKESLGNGANDETIVDGMERMLPNHFPRHALSHFLRKHKHKFSDHIKITPHQKILVENHIKNSAHPLNTSLLCEELESHPELFLPRHLLGKCVRLAQNHYFLSQVTHEQRNAVDEHVKAASAQARLNPRKLCAELSSQIKLPQQTLYILVRTACIRHSIHSLSQEHRKLITLYVSSSAHKNISLLCNELQKHVDIPRDALRALVNVSNRGKITRADRRIVLEHVQQSPRPFDVPLICDELRDRFAHLSKYRLYRLVRSCCISVELRSAVTSEMRQMIEQHIENATHADIPQLTKEMQDTAGSRISRKTLRSLVESAVQKFDREVISQEQRKMILEHVLQSPRPLDAPSICDQLHSLIPHLSRHRLYRIVHSCCVSVERKMISPNVRQLVEQHVAGTNHRDVSLLCDELQDAVGLDIARTTLRKIVENAMRKQERKSRSRTIHPELEQTA